MQGEENREFLDTVQYFRRRIHVADFLSKTVSALFVGAGVGIVFQVVALLQPFYHANLFTALAVLLALAAAFGVAVLKRCSMKDAALVMDGFGFKERIVTAYENLDQEGGLAVLQRRDAIKQLRENKGRIRIRLLPAGGRLAVLAAMLLALPALSLLPSAAKDRARELHFLKQEAEEKAKELEETLEGLEALEEQGARELTAEELAALQEMMDSLKASLSEYRQAASAEAVAVAGEKLDFKYGAMAEQMSRLAAGLQGNPAVSVPVAEAAGEMADRLQSMSGRSEPGAGGMMADRGDGTGSGNKDGNGGGSGNGNKDGNGDGAGSGDKDGSGDGAGNGNGDGSGNGDKDGNGDGVGNGNGDGSGSGDKDGNGSGTGDGNGSGAGSGDGSGNGGGTGSGGGTGAGTGRGEGSSSLRHDYVSVPNAVADSGNLTGDAAGHENSDYFRAQNGLGWEGEHISHEAVIGSYEKKAYEGISSGRYPDGMEEVIKDYFSGF